MAGISRVACGATLEESAKDLAGKIAAALPAQEAFSLEIRNHSSLRPDQISRIEQSLKAELQNRNANLTDKSAGDSVVVTLSENWKELVWTGEIHQGERSSVVMLSLPRTGENQPISNAMHITVRSEKFWEGPERILDAVEIGNGTGKSWLVLLYTSAVAVQDLQSGAAARIDLPAATPVREPSGRLAAQPGGNSVLLSVGPLVCEIDLETRSSAGCSSPADSTGNGASGRPLIPQDLTPSGAPPPGKGTALAIAPVCGGANQFLATSARDYTQPDSLQVFQMEPNGPVAMSAESDLPGPVLGLHTASGAPRAIVRNLSTGNYEAYRLDISCGQ